jgi:hypothetical protein
MRPVVDLLRPRWHSVHKLSLDTPVVKADVEKGDPSGADPLESRAADIAGLQWLRRVWPFSSSKKR